jgi:hypothetical protein
MLRVNNLIGFGGKPKIPSVLLLPMTGSDGSTTFTDVYGHTVTANGNAQIDTAQADPFGGSSGVLMLDGTGDYLSIPYSTSDFNWWSTSFTIECFVYISTLSDWYYLDGTNKPAMIGNADHAGATNYWSFGPNSGGVISFYYWNGSAKNISSTATVSTGAWTHIAMVHTLGTGVKLYVGGVGNTNTAVVGTPQSSAAYSLKIGQINNRSINGYMSNLRITKGARYTGDFTPPTFPFTE